MTIICSCHGISKEQIISSVKRLDGPNISKIFKDLDCKPKCCKCVPRINREIQMNDELRIAIIFRKDISIPPGKAEVQAAHAAVSVLYETVTTDKELAKHYIENHQTKISLEVDTLEEMMKIYNKAKKRNITACLITDAGRTVFNEPTITCIGVGPMSKTDCNSITRGASLR